MSKVITIKGDLLNKAAAEELSRDVTSACESGQNQIVVDFRAVTNINSYGINAMMQCHQSVTANQGQLKFQNVDAHIKTILSTLLFDRFFNLE